ncbi:hypothetical protein AB4383_03965 [Vibrio breoganii]
MERNDITIAALAIVSGAAAAMGPIGVPAFLATATMGTILALLGGDETDEDKLDENRMGTLLTNHFAENAARSAWSKIHPSLTYYHDYVKRAQGGEVFSERDLKQLDSAIIGALGPNSQLLQGLSLLYGKQSGKQSDYDNVQHNFPIYMLGVSIYIQYRLLEITRQETNGEEISRPQWSSLSKDIQIYIGHVMKISQYIESYTIEVIVRNEMSNKQYAMGSKEMQDRLTELHQHYIGDTNAAVDLTQSLYEIKAEIDTKARQA